MAELLRKEPEARAILVAITVTIVYIGHATIPLRAWQTKDSPRYPIGFPLATAFIFSSVFVQLGMLWWQRHYKRSDGYNFDTQSQVSVVATRVVNAKSSSEGGIKVRGDSKNLNPEISEA
jgi:hypothetical protein